ncbi:MAG: hypothetical protein R3174_04580 [Gammaproteobacteria bacterium]|nr:hypothetical protein [Gammaproteobacteria bacterium]
MKLKILYEQPWRYSICATDRSDRPVIVVLCGGAAMYNVVVELSDEEASRFSSDPAALDDLAFAIQKDSSSFADRIVKQIGAEPLEFVEDL